MLGGIDRIDGTFGNTILDGETVDQVLSFSLLSATLLFLAPALLGLAIAIVPLQVGARAIAFPRAAAASFWAFLLGGALTVTAFAMNGGPGGGSADGVDLWVLATGMVAAALVLASICVGTTVLAARTEGMSVDRVPMFAWSMLCTATIWIVTLPVLVAVLIVLYLDHRYGQVFIGGDGPAMVLHVSWIARQPQVYALAIPLLGLALDAATTASGTRLANRGAAQAAIGVFSVLGIGAFALASIVPAAAEQPVTKGMALLAPLPVLVVLGLVGLTLRSGRPKVTSGLVGSVVGLLVLLLATVVGAALPFQSWLELAGTQWVSAQSHLTMVAAFLGLLAGLYHWATKVGGRAASEALGRTAPIVIGVGALLLAVPQAISGLTGEGDEVLYGIEAMNAAAVAGGVLIVLGALLAVAGLVGRSRDDEPADPWGGQTLEWATASPPSFANFDGDVPEVTSPEPLLADDTAEEASA
jgi:heme/copper-type cytochrome/quinol oxidase subunit 1